MRNKNKVIFYLVARPETVVSLVKTGVLPNDLPPYLSASIPKNLRCFSDIRLSITDCSTKADQLFVLKLQIPQWVIGKNKVVYSIDRIESNWVVQIVVHSLRSKKLVERLFKNHCPLPVKINPACYKVINSNTKSKATLYLATRPETIVSLVNTGTLPNGIPPYLKTLIPSYLHCFSDIIMCVTHCHTKADQLFLLSLQVPQALIEKNKKIYSLDQVSPDSIMQIIVYSKRSKKLVERLFKNHCPLPIEIRPTCYETTVLKPGANRGNKRKLEQVKVEQTPLKKVKTNNKKCTNNINFVVADTKKEEKQGIIKKHVNKSSILPAQIELNCANVIGRYGLFKYGGNRQQEAKNLFEKNLPKGFKLSTAIGKGDCFYDAAAQALNQLEKRNHYSIKSLRLLCSDYTVELDKHCKNNCKHPDNWLGRHFKNNLDYNYYMANVKYTAAECARGYGLNNKGLAIWGEQHIDAVILCKKLNVKIHIMEVQEVPIDNEGKQTRQIVMHRIADAKGSISTNEINYNDNNTIHLAVYNNHFVPLLKKITIQKPVPIPCSNEPSQSQQQIFNEDKGIAMGLQRLSTRAEHIKLLKFAFLYAKHSILITSYGINILTLEASGLCDLILDAFKRGVKLYIYYSDQKEVDEVIIEYLTLACATFDEAYTHSKILVMDDEIVAMGSYNWLSDVDYRYKPNCQGSIVYRGKIYGLKQEIWNHIKYYRNRQFGNIRAVKKFQRNTIKVIPKTYVLDKNEDNDKVSNDFNISTMTYLPTLKGHRTFFRQFFKSAEDIIILCSPFISRQPEYKKDLTKRLLLNAIRRDLSIIFVCSEKDKNLAAFRRYIKGISTNIHIIATDNFHLKTIVIDDEIIVDGSFNWLSASRDLESDYHNHEASIMIEGPLADPLIENFYNSQTGQVVLEYMYAQGIVEDKNSSEGSDFGTCPNFNF